MNPFQFKIPARQKKCLQCSKAFEDNEQIFSTVGGEEESPVRKDFCESCFDEKNLPEDIWGHWHTVLKKQKVQLTPDEKAMELFFDAYQKEDTEYLLFIANYLKRKKQLLMRPEIKKETMLFFEDPKTSEVYAIPKKEISPTRLTEFKKLFLENLSSSD